MPVSRAGRWLIRAEGRRTAVCEVYSDDDPTRDEAAMDGTVQSRGGSAVMNVIGSFPEAAGVAKAELLRVLSLDPVTVTCDLSGVTGELDERGAPGAVGHRRAPRALVGHLGGPGVAPAGRGGAARAVRRQRAPAARPTAQIQLDPHPRAVRSVIGSAVLVVGELVANGLTHA